MKTNSEFAQMLQINRIKRNITQKQLADAIGVSEVSIRNYENDLRVPGLLEKLLLLKALNLNPEKLFFQKMKNIKLAY